MKKRVSRGLVSFMLGVILFMSNYVTSRADVVSEPVTDGAGVWIWLAVILGIPLLIIMVMGIMKLLDKKK